MQAPEKFYTIMLHNLLEKIILANLGTDVLQKIFNAEIILWKDIALQSCN